MPPVISSDLQMECKTFRRYLTNQPMEDMNKQLKELSTSSMFETVSKLEYPCRSMSDPSNRNCFGGAPLLENENDKNLIEESPGRS